MASAESLASVRNSLLLAEFGDEELSSLASSMEEKAFKKGQLLFEQDKAGDALFLVLSGQVGILWKGEGKVAERMIAVVGAGESVGEMSLVDEGPRSATGKALEDVKAIMLSKAAYDDLRRSSPRVAVKLLLGVFKLLSKRIRAFDRNIEIASYWLFSS